MATDRTGTTAINVGNALTDLASIESSVRTFKSSHLDATSSAHLNYRAAVDRLLEELTSIKRMLQANDNLAP